MKENPLLLKESNLLLVLHLFLEYKKSFHLIFKIYERGYLQKSKDKNSCITKNPKNEEKKQKTKIFLSLKKYEVILHNRSYYKICIVYFVTQIIFEEGFNNINNKKEGLKHRVNDYWYICEPNVQHFQKRKK